MVYKNILTIGLVIVLIFGLGCVDTQSKSGTEKERDLVKNPVMTTAISSIETVTPIQTTYTAVVKNFVSIANKTMARDETWNVGGGWVLAINGIDTKLDPREVWFTLSKDGNVVDETIMTMGKIYSYNRSNRFFSAKVSSIFAGKYEVDKYRKPIGIVVTDDRYFVLFEDIKYQID